MIGSGVAESLISPSSYIEKHTLSGTVEDVLRFAIGKNVTINVEEQPADVSRVRDSARANSQLLSEYKGDKRESEVTSGRILAVRDKLIAYRLFNDTTGEAVRVMERESRNRQLIKDFRHPIVDLQWAVHVPLLAVLDANANLYIYSEEENGQKLIKYLNIIQEGDHISAEPRRLVWCPYIPEETDDPDTEREDVHMLGVLQGPKVNIFQLHKIKRFIGRSEVSYSRVKEVPGGLLSVMLDSRISACRISPDATALAVATFDGFLSFFVVEEDALQLASRIKPLNNNHIEELIFLDNLFLNTQEQFWKYVTLTSDNGRRLAIFDCDTWECLAKLRFECANQVGRMEILVEPSSHFLFLIDYDASNIFCIELSNGQSCATLCFASCTLITFCTQFMSIVPCMLSEPVSDSVGDLSLEDDEGMGGGNDGAFLHGSSVIATLVAITHRSLLEINLELDRFYNVDPSLALTAVPQTAQLGRSRHQRRHSGRICAHQRDSITQKDNTPSLVFMAGTNGGNVDQKLTDLVEQRFTILTDKFEELSLQMCQMQEENEHLRSVQNDNLSNVLEKISNELKLREERIEAAVRKTSKEGSEQMLRTSEQQLASCAVQMQRTLDLAQTRLAEQLHGSVERAVVPQIEVLCAQLFQQLNDTFRNGLQEFMDQLRAITQQQTAMLAAVQAQSAVVVAAIGAKEVIGGSGGSSGVGDAHQQPQHQPPVINKGDQSLLNFVCSKVDPDDYFEVSVSNPSVPLPIPLLLGLLRMLSTKLDSKTVLRFRYIENVLLSLNSKHSLLTTEEFQKMVLDEQQFRWTIEQLYKSLNAFEEGEANPQLKRQLRISNQLIMNLLRST
uniref:Ge1_WD40 domain-containing protein n=1 Tax=Globodera pallida TaxID=36090 RepID=A0A183C409_GLOPA